MPIETTYTRARENLAALWDEVTANREIAIIHRRGAKDVALIEAGELRGLIETAHLLRSPRNAQRLIAALTRALENGGSPISVEQLRQQMGLASAAESRAESGAETS